jgi:hypothetical protein
MGGSGPSLATGPVDWPTYMKSWHGSALLTTGESLNVTLTSAMNETFAANPYNGLPVRTAEDILLGGKLLSEYDTPFSFLSIFSLLSVSSMLADFRASSQLSLLLKDVNPLLAEITTTELSLRESKLDQETLTNYKVMMRSANAVMSSSFVVGEALLRGDSLKPLVETNTTMIQKAILTQVQIVKEAEVLSFRSAVTGIKVREMIVNMIADFTKLYTITKIELDNYSIELTAKGTLWNSQVFQYGGNFLGSINGKIAAWVDPGESSVTMTYGQGIISGISMGAQIGSCFGPVGTVIGVIVGAIVGAIMGYIANEYHYASASDAAINLPIDVFNRGTFLQRFIIFGFGW